MSSIVDYTDRSTCIIFGDVDCFIRTHYEGLSNRMNSEV
jgi:hypothetical protein